MAGPILYQNPASTQDLPGGDPYAKAAGEASQAVEENRRRTNAALAQAAQAGRQIVSQGQQQITSARDMAIQQAMAEAQRRNAPADAQALISQRISDPYNQRVTSLDQGAANRDLDLSYRQAGANQYYDQVAPAVGLSHDRALGAYQRERARQDAERAAQQAQLENQVAMAKYNAEQDAIARQWQQQQAEREFNYKVQLDQQQFDEDVRRWGLDFALEKWKAEQANARASSGGGGGGRGGGGSSGFLGTGYNQSELKSLIPDAIGQIRRAVDPSGLTQSGLAKVSGIDKLTRTAAAGTVANQLGVPGGSIMSLLPKYKSGLGQSGQGILAPGPGGKFGPNPDLQQQQGRGEIYSQATSVIQQLIDQDVDPLEIIRQARSSALYSTDSTAVDSAIRDMLPGYG